MSRRAMRRTEPGVRLTDLVTLGALTQSVPPQMVDQVLQQTGRQSRRIRDLPAPLVTYLVIALALFRAEETREVLRLLQEGGRRLLGWSALLRAPASRAGITRARVRLGEAPLRALFEAVARPIATAQTRGGWYRGWRLMVLDGSTLETPDTEANAAAFTRPGNGAGEAARPCLRLATLIEAGTHVVVAARMGPYTEAEKTLAGPLLGHLEAGMLCLADRLYPGYALWQQACSTGAALLWRVCTRFSLPVLEVLEDGSYRSCLFQGWSQGKAYGKRLEVRVIEYEIEGQAERYRLITNVLDPAAAPAGELAPLYHERWEGEATLDEFKTHLRGASTLLRSQRPDLVRQEVWGVLLAHYALRCLMHEAALRGGRDPDRISFVHTVRVVRRSLPEFAAFPPSAVELAP